MSNPDPVAAAEAQLAEAEKALAEAEKQDMQVDPKAADHPSLLERIEDVVAPVKEGEPEPAAEPAPAEKSTEELLAAAPPLVLPQGTHMVKQCPGCGLKMEDPPAGMRCPNCGTTVP